MTRARCRMMLVGVLSSLIASSAIAASLDAQIIDRVKQKVKDKMSEKHDPPADSTASAPVAAAPSTAAAAQDVVLVNYDFVPGDRVIYAEDFTKDNVGDFAKRLKLVQGNFEVADRNGQRMLRTNSGGEVRIPLPEVLPKRFTFEADYIGGGGWSMTVWFVDNEQREGKASAHFSPVDGGLDGPVPASASVPENAQRPITHIAVMADGDYVKAYVNGVRVANVPEAPLGRSNGIYMGFVADGDTPAYIANIRVAEGGKKLYDAIAASGRAVTHGILFATASDQIRGESTPTLKEIGDMLKQHPDLKLTIEGHTDNVGQAAANQSLSERRAAAVKQYLVANFGVDASRLATKGYGASKPAASNDTPEGRQQNRRVELVKM